MTTGRVTRSQKRVIEDVPSEPRGKRIRTQNQQPNVANCSAKARNPPSVRQNKGSSTSNCDYNKPASGRGKQAKRGQQGAGDDGPLAERDQNLATSSPAPAPQTSPGAQLAQGIDTAVACHTSAAPCGSTAAPASGLGGSIGTPHAPGSDLKRRRSPSSNRSPKQNRQEQDAAAARQPSAAAASAQRSNVTATHQPGSGAHQTQQLLQDKDWFDPLDADKVQEARVALSVSHGAWGRVPLGREEQVQRIDKFLEAHVGGMAGGSMYISGVPGTGKSLTVHELLLRCARHAEASALCTLPPAVVSINCMTVRDNKSIFTHVANGIEQACSQRYTGLRRTASAPASAAAADAAASASAAGADASAAAAATVTARDDGGGLIVYLAPSDGDLAGDEAGGDSSSAPGLKRLQRLVTAPVLGSAGMGTSSSHRRKSLGGGGGRNSRGAFVVVLDELDSLLERDASTLYELFLLPQLPGSRLVLLGIANSIDLTERALPRLRELGAQPEVLCFPAYTQGDVDAVIKQRLQALPGPVFAPPALMFCSRKVSAGSGDMRRALEVCAKALELLVSSAREAYAADNAATANAGADADDDDAGEQEAGSSGGQGRPPPPAAAAARLVGMREMASAIASSSGGLGAGSAVVQAMRQLPLQQQLLLCAACKSIGYGGGGGGSSNGGTAEAMGMGGLSRSNSLAGCGGSFSRADSFGFGSSKGGGGGSRRMSLGTLRRLSTGSLGGGGGGGSKSRRSSIGLGVAGGAGDGPRNGGGGARDTTQGQLVDVYTALCRQVGMAAVSAAEVSLMCSTLADSGLLGIGSSGGGDQRDERRRRITCPITPDDVMLALQDVRMLRHVLEGCCSASGSGGAH